MSQQWYVQQNGRQAGPYSLEQLRQEALLGRIKPADMVWDQKVNSWVRADRVPGLFDQPRALAHPRHRPLAAAVCRAAGQYGKAKGCSLD